MVHRQNIVPSHTWALPTRRFQTRSHASAPQTCLRWRLKQRTWLPQALSPRAFWRVAGQQLHGCGRECPFSLSCGQPELLEKSPKESLIWCLLLRLPLRGRQSSIRSAPATLRVSRLTACSWPLPSSFVPATQHLDPSSPQATLPWHLFLTIRFWSGKFATRNSRFCHSALTSAIWICPSALITSFQPVRDLPWALWSVSLSVQCLSICPSDQIASFRPAGDSPWSVSLSLQCFFICPSARTAYFQARGWILS